MVGPSRFQQLEAVLTVSERFDQVIDYFVLVLHKRVPFRVSLASWSAADAIECSAAPAE
jgi:hypothetical protein